MIATPLDASIELTGVDGADPITVTSSAVVDPGLPLFTGHYPGFPIFPGVCLIEIVHQSVLRAAEKRGHGASLAEIRSTRFLAPAFPMDLVTSTIQVSPDEHTWDCRATLYRGETRLATVRVHYRIEDVT